MAYIFSTDILKHGKRGGEPSQYTRLCFNKCRRRRQIFGHLLKAQVQSKFT